MSGSEAPISIPGYENWILLGRGGFASVYRAYQPKLDRHVAVKVLRVGSLDDATRRRFDREQRTMGSLSGHPAIVTLFDSGFAEDGTPYLVMELMPGGSLQDRIDRRGPLPWREAVDVILEISGAVALAHERGVLHRDIKPDNVLVSEFGEVKLTDFGIATLVEGTATATAGVTATLDYAPPEVLSGGQAIPASDVYGLGATLFALLCGRAPFRSGIEDTAAGILAGVLTAPVPDLRPAGVPAPVCEALEAAMAKSAAERPPSASAFAALLGHAAAGTGAGGEAAPTRVLAPAPAVDAGATRRLRPPERRRRRVGVWLALLAAAVLLGAAGAALPLLLDDDDAPVATEAAPETSAAGPGWACGAAGELLTFHDFEDGAAAGWSGVAEDPSAGWAVVSTEEGRLLRAAYTGKGDLSDVVFGDDPLADAVVRFSMRMRGGGQKALQIDWRRDGSGDGTFLADVAQFQPERGALVRLRAEPGSEEPSSAQLASWPAPYPAGAAIDTWHGYEVAHADGRLEVWIDGVEVAAVDLPEDGAAQPALVAWIAGESGTVDVDDLAVCRLNGDFESTWPW